MKTATFPSVRVDPELRQAAESVLHEGESLSSFVEGAIRENVERRQFRQAFIARGISAGQRARQTGVYATSDAVVGRIEKMLADAKARR